MGFASLIEAIYHYSKITPNNICLIDANTDKKYTYSEFWERICVFAEVLKSNGLKKGERVTVRVGNLMETLVAQFAINLVGGIYCPVERKMKEAKIIEMLEYFDSKMLISTDNINFDVKWIDLTEVCIHSSKNIQSETKFDFPDTEDVCAIIFTTGTTGKAKGVMIRYKAIIIYSEERREAFGITGDDIFLWIIPLDRVGGVRMFGSSFISGGTAVYYNGIVFINDFFKAIEKYCVTVIFLQSYPLAYLLKSDAESFANFKDQIRIMIFGGGAIPERHKRQICELLPNTTVYIVYTATEISCVAYYEYKAHYREKPNCVGRPFPHVDIYMADEHGNLIKNTSKNNLGIIRCKCREVTLGYWKEPELTAQVLDDGYITMTDVGYIDSDGFIYIMGRKDEVIVTGGFKVAPYEIEEVAAQMKDIVECACVPVTDNTLGMIPRLFVVMKIDAEFSSDKISAYLSEHLETYKLPRIITEIKSLPKVNGTHKIDRKALLKYD